MFHISPTFFPFVFNKVIPSQYTWGIPLYKIKIFTDNKTSDSPINKIIIMTITIIRYQRQLLFNKIILDKNYSLTVVVFNNNGFDYNVTYSKDYFIGLLKIGELSLM